MNEHVLKQRIHRYIINNELISIKKKKEENLENVINHLRSIESYLKNHYNEYKRITSNRFKCLIQIEISNIFNSYQSFLIKISNPDFTANNKSTKSVKLQKLKTEQLNICKNDKEKENEHINFNKEDKWCFEKEKKKKHAENGDDKQEENLRKRYYMSPNEKKNKAYVEQENKTKELNKQMENTKKDMNIDNSKTIDERPKQNEKDITQKEQKIEKLINMKKPIKNFITTLSGKAGNKSIEKTTKELLSFINYRIEKKVNKLMQTDMHKTTMNNLNLKEKIVPTKTNTDLDGYKGINSIKKDILYSIIYPYKYSSTYIDILINITGVSGAGKTTLAFAIAGECKCDFFYIRLPEYIKYLSYDLKENKLETLFRTIKTKYQKGIICIDDVDVLFNSKEENTDIYLFTYLLELFHNTNIIILLLSINIPYETILYRKIQKFISIPIPTYEDRLEIFQKLSNEFGIEFDITHAASNTYGFNRGQMFDLVKESINLFTYNDVKDEELQNKNESHLIKDNQLEALNKKSNSDTENQKKENKNVKDTANEENIYLSNEKDENLKTVKRKEIIYDEITEKETKRKKISILISENIIYESIKNVKKKITTKNLCDVPNISLDNIGALKKIKKCLESKFILPVKYSKIYKHLGINKSMGILLYGPPGCGKTMLAKAISNEMKANFIAIKGPEILNKYVGESEKKVREIFACASLYKPCLIFFDEIDSICTNRTGDKNSQASERVVNQLLSEMDGLTQREGVYIIATTNRPEIIDSALLRSGRFDQLIYVPLPNYQGRIDILKKLSKNMPIDQKVDFSKIANKTKGYSGADLFGVLRESAFIALRSCKQKFDALDIIDPLIKNDSKSIVDKVFPEKRKEWQCFEMCLENNRIPEKDEKEKEIVTRNENSSDINIQKTGEKVEKRIINERNVIYQENNSEKENTDLTFIKEINHEINPYSENGCNDIIRNFNSLKKMENCKKEMNEYDLNNLIYEFIQKNKHILRIEEKHILSAIKIIPKSVSKAQIQYYKKICQNYK